MIKFNIDSLRVEHVRLKSCTTALGGSVTIVDNEKSGDKEVYKRIKAPLAIVRKFIIRQGGGSFLNPILVALTYYENDVVALEGHQLMDKGSEVYEGIEEDEEVDWISNSERHISNISRLVTDDWMFDGVYIYNPVNELQPRDNLSEDNKFQSLHVTAIQISNIAFSDDALLSVRTCLSFTPNTGETVITPPIWKNIYNVGTVQLKYSDSDDNVAEIDSRVNGFQFDRIDEFLSVNLSFAIKTANELSTEFGYDSIEPLALDDLMIQLNTVNLPKIPHSIKQTIDIGMPFTHAVAWLIGLMNRVDTYEQLKVIRSSLKMLTTKGIYRKGAFDTTSLFKSGNNEEIPLVTIEEAKSIELTDEQHYNMFVKSTKNSNDYTAFGTT